MLHRMFLLLVLAPVLVLGACGGSGSSGNGGSGSALGKDNAALVRDQGYALLYATIKDDADVDKVLILKHPAASVADVLKAIGQFCRDAKGTLETIAKEDPAVSLENQGLGEVEQKTREAISSTTSHQILFHGGKEFEVRILLTQHEALNYITHLSATLADRDPRENRKRYLKDLSKRAAELHDRILDQLIRPK